MIHLNQAASLSLIYLYRATFGEVPMLKTEQVDDFFTKLLFNKVFVEM